MGETLQEQIDYGRWCMHGRPLGTPGGADLMCGDCEDGLTEWVESPRFELRFRVGDGQHSDDLGVHNTLAARPGMTVARLAAWQRKWKRRDGLDWPLGVFMHMVEAGYWISPSVDHCPACGEPIDYCQGHGEIGDPVGYAILRAHEQGDHSECEAGADCDEHCPCGTTCDGPARCECWCHLEEREDG